MAQRTMSSYKSVHLPTNIMFDQMGLWITVSNSTVSFSDISKFKKKTYFCNFSIIFQIAFGNKML